MIRSNRNIITENLFIELIKKDIKELDNFMEKKKNG